MHFLAARYGAHAANSRHAGGAAVLEDVSHDSDDECRARVDEWYALSFQKKTRHRFSPSRSSSSIATTPLLLAEAVGHYSVVASMFINQLLGVLAMYSVAYGTALQGPDRTSALICPPPNFAPLGFFSFTLPCKTHL